MRKITSDAKQNSCSKLAVPCETMQNTDRAKLGEMKMLCITYAKRNNVTMQNEITDAKNMKRPT